jgi:uncharacterized protein
MTEPAAGAPIMLNPGSLSGRPFLVDANAVVTGRTCILGSSGSGKSYTVGVMCEELCKGNVPFAVVDTEGEYSGLKELYNVFWVGEDDGCDQRWSTLDEGQLAARALELPPLILDLSRVDDQKGRVSRFLTAVYDEISRVRTPYLLIVEEADRFVPQQGERLPIFGEIARRGRKRGVGLMVCSQRPSMIDKNILSQCANQIIGKLVIQNDLQSVAQFFPGRGLPRELTTLRPGMFYFLGGLSSEPSLVRIKARLTRPGGANPLLGQRRRVPLQGSPSGSVIQTAETSKAAPARAPLQTASTRASAGLVPSVAESDVPALVRRERSYVLFGHEETITSLKLTWRTLIELGVSLRTGILRKRFETSYLFIDGEVGRIAEFGGGLALHDGIEKLVGLTTVQIQLLFSLDPDRDIGIVDVAGRTGGSGGNARRVMGVLENRRLVGGSLVGRAKVYRRLVEAPHAIWSDEPLLLGEVDIAGSDATPLKLSEAAVSEVVRGLWSGSELEGFRPFLYPLYKVELALDKRRRVIWLDGRTGWPAAGI